MSKYTVGGLFSGIGGLELAFQEAGFKISWSNELDNDACKTYELNHPKHNLIKGDIWTLLKEDTFPSSSVDVLVGGFPCQSFSVAGGVSIIQVMENIENHAVPKSCSMK